MDGVLHDIFGLVCGQHTAHTWAPAGEQLPLCQRCTGIYAGFIAALAVRIVARPPQGARWTLLHALFVAQIAPAGLHLFPQGPLLRTLSGAVFAAGLAYFLLLALPQAAGHTVRRRPARGGLYSLGLANAVAVPPALAASDLAAAPSVLVGLCVAGLAALAGAALACVASLALTRLSPRPCDRHRPRRDGRPSPTGVATES